jgi:predicted benzoate:H+ symporter BenE
MTALLAFLIFSELVVIVGIDRPFSGAVKVAPNPLAAVLADVESRPNSGSRF